MAELRIDSRMKVKTLKANFKKAFGATLRVYTTSTCKAKADDEATFGSRKNPQKCTASECRLQTQLTPSSATTR